MAEYFKYLRQLLAMQGESFEEELQRLVTLSSSNPTVKISYYSILNSGSLE